MKRRYKILGIGLAVIALGVGSLMLYMSHDAPCSPSPPLPAGAARMKGVIYRCYGPPEVLRLEDVVKPTPRDNEVLVRVRAASVNPLDWHEMRGMPYLVRMSTGFGAPEFERLGTDFAGTIEAVGKNVKRFKPGDEVFGGGGGAFSEYMRVREDRGIALKPPNLSFEEAAAIPVAGITALQALRDKGHIQAGQKVLINGASGGVGTFAVQLAKSYGAEVTGVCSTRNVELVRSLGADHVIDYTREDFTLRPEAYDLIVDNVGSHGLLEYRRVLKPNATLVLVGGPNEGQWLGPLMGVVKAMVLSPFVSQKFGLILAELTAQDLAYLGDLTQSGKMKPAIDRRYALSETPAAIAYLETGRARAKVVIHLD